MITFLVVVAVSAFAAGVLFGLRGCRCRWLCGPNEPAERQP